MIENQKTQNVNRRLLTIRDWVRLHNWPPEGGLRHLVFNAKQNGFDKVIRRIGRRVLINEQAFFRWVEEKNNGGE